MKNQTKNTTNLSVQDKEITRKEALEKIGNYSKYTALTAIGTYLILNPKNAQAASGGNPTNLGASGF